jgi:hypothetical protein
MNYWWLAGLVVWGLDCETRGPGLKSRQWVGVFVMNNYTHELRLFIYIIINQYNLCIYNLCTFIR